MRNVRQHPKLMLRLPEDLKAFIESEAAKNGRSMNSEILSCIAGRYPRAGVSTTELRDWFAGQALAGLLSEPTDTNDEWNPRIIAGAAYAYADAMLVERAKGGAA